jgi:Kef-type K+ transport system membrane component KefB
MNELASLGVILFFALLAGHLVKVVRVPEVTGYMLAGVAVGPSFLGWITYDNLETLEVFSEVALGLILFSIGSVFEISRFRVIGRQALLVTATESLLCGALVTAGMLFAGQSWDIAFLLGAISMGTGAASTLMVIRECNSEGTLTETLTGVIALNNIFCLVSFSLVASAIDLAAHSEASWGAAIYTSLFPLAWQMIGSVALGFLIGLLLSLWSQNVVEHGEILILMGGSVLLCVGFAQWLDVSPLVASLAVGATTVNISKRSESLFKSLSQTDPPLYAIFFVIGGADLNLGLLGSLGILGFIYVIGRTGGKFFGSRYGARRAGLDAMTQKWIGFSILAQAGLAIGLVLIVNQRFPKLGGTVTTVVLASVALFELIGPLAARFALLGSGESRPDVASESLT